MLAQSGSTVPAWTLWLPVMASLVAGLLGLVGVLIAERRAQRREATIWARTRISDGWANAQAAAEQFILASWSYNSAHARGLPRPEQEWDAAMMKFARCCATLRTLTPTPTMPPLDLWKAQVEDYCTWAREAADPVSLPEAPEGPVDPSAARSGLDEVYRRLLLEHTGLT